MSELQSIRTICLNNIATGAWTPLPDLKRLFTERQRQGLGATLACLVRDRSVWHSYEAVVLDDQPILIARYCRPHEIGDPLIGRKIVREAAE